MLFNGAVVSDNARVLHRRHQGRSAGREGALVSDRGRNRASSAALRLRHGMRIWPDVVLPPHGVQFSADI